MSLLPIGIGTTGGYEIGKSLRFRASASAYLSRTPASAGNRKTFTFSAWVKRGALDGGRMSGIFQGYIDTDNAWRIDFDGSDKLFVGNSVAGISTVIFATPVFRDPSAHFHLLVSVDTTQATASNRTVIYINGVAQSVTGSYVAQNTDLLVNYGIAHYIGNDATAAGRTLDGYLSEINFIDGQALTPSSFGETSATGSWVPKAYTGTYGTNGFYLPFDVGTSLTTLAQDRSGNGNNWTTTNVSLTAGSTYDWMDDTPTNNFATLNPLLAGTSSLTNGNLTSAGATLAPTILPTSGTWYLERDGTALTWTPPAAFPSAAGAYNFGQRPFTGSPTHPTLCTSNLTFASITTSGTFTGNASTDGPFVWLGGNPSTMTINGNAVTWGTHADKTAGGFKVRSSSTSYNTAGSNSYSVTVTGQPFGDSTHEPNNAQGNP
jgi:hypothetical protein